MQRPSAQILDVTLIVENCGFDIDTTENLSKLIDQIRPFMPTSPAILGKAAPINRLRNIQAHLFSQSLDISSTMLRWGYDDSFTGRRHLNQVCRFALLAFSNQNIHMAPLLQKSDGPGRRIATVVPLIEALVKLIAREVNLKDPSVQVVEVGAMLEQLTAVRHGNCPIRNGLKKAHSLNMGSIIQGFQNLSLIKALDVNHTLFSFSEI